MSLPAAIVPRFSIDHNAEPGNGLTAALARLLVDLDRRLTVAETEAEMGGPRHE